MASKSNGIATLNEQDMKQVEGGVLPILIGTGVGLVALEIARGGKDIKAAVDAASDAVDTVVEKVVEQGNEYYGGGGEDGK